MVATRAVLVGLGHRTACYASYANQSDDELKIVAIADPDPVRRKAFQDKWELPIDACFEDAESLAKAAPVAEVAINGTMDEIHVDTTIPLLEAGYHVLLEKPIAPNKEELKRLSDAVDRTGKRVMICHVLRYAPFYIEIKRLVESGRLGELTHIHTTENVSYHHTVVAFVRGKWNRREVNPIMLAKCCHDLDLLCWFNSGTPPTAVASFGGRHIFTTENKPTTASSNCFDCEIEVDCLYSAKKHYIDNNWWPFYALAGNTAYDSGQHLDPSDKSDYVKGNEYGRCVWDCDNDVVDRQSVIVEFADGVVATHDLVTNVARGTRTIQLVGTLGEIEGDMSEGKFTLREPNLSSPDGYTEEFFDVGVEGDLHGGGDLRLVADFLALVRGDSPSLSSTTLEDSLNSHFLAYAADESMNKGTVIRLDS